MLEEDKKLLNYASYIADIVNNKLVIYNIKSKTKTKQFCSIYATVIVQEVTKRYFIVNILFKGDFEHIPPMINIPIYCNLNLSPNTIIGSIKSKFNTYTHYYINNNNLDTEQLVDEYMSKLADQIIKTVDISELNDITTTKFNKYL